MNIKALARRLREAGYRHAAKGLVNVTTFPAVRPDVNGIMLLVDKDPVGTFIATRTDQGKAQVVASEHETYIARPERRRVARPKKRTAFYNIRCEPETRARWDAAAQALGYTNTELVEVAVEAYLATRPGGI